MKGDNSPQSFDLATDQDWLVLSSIHSGTLPIGLPVLLADSDPSVRSLALQFRNFLDSPPN